MILKANTVDTKLLWIRRMRQLIQDTYFGSRLVISSLTGSCKHLHDHLLQLQLGAGHLAYLVGAAGQGHLDHQPEEQQVGIILNSRSQNNSSIS